MMGTLSRKVGLALSGGGARGLAHIGVLQVLEQGGVPIDCLAGASMGGVIATWYAAGSEPESIKQEALRMTSLRHLLTLAAPSLSHRGILEGQQVRKYLDGHLGDRTFDDLPLPLALVAVDLNGGCEVILRDGRLVDAVRATVAFPGVLAPVKQNGQLLVDGSLLDSLAANAARRIGADIVIAVDVTADQKDVCSLFEEWRNRRYIPNGLVGTAEVLFRSLEVMMADIHRRRLAEARPEIIIRPVIPPGVTVLTGFSRAAEIIAAGEKAALEALPRIQALLAPPASEALVEYAHPPRPTSPALPPEIGRSESVKRKLWEEPKVCGDF